MIGYFKDRGSFQVPALLFITLALKLTFINHPHHDSIATPGGILPLWLSASIYPKLNPSFVSTLAVIILFFSALFANYLLSASRMFSRNNMLVALSMMLFTSLFPASNQLSATTILLPLVILLFQQITRLYNASKVRGILINIGMIIGTGYLLYHPFLWLVPCCFIGLAGMRPFRINEWLLLLLGILTPAYFLLSYEFLTDQWNPLLHTPHWQLYKQVPKISVMWWIGIGAAGVWLLAGLAGWQNHMRRMLIQSRKNWYQLLFIGLFIIPMGAIPAGNVSEMLTLLSFPAASLGANAFASKEKSMAPVLLFWLIVIALATTSWMYMR